MDALNRLTDLRGEGGLGRLEEEISEKRVYTHTHTHTHTPICPWTQTAMW